MGRSNESSGQMAKRLGRYPQYLQRKKEVKAKKRSIIKVDSEKTIVVDSPMVTEIASGDVENYPLSLNRADGTPVPSGEITTIMNLWIKVHMDYCRCFPVILFNLVSSRHSLGGDEVFWDCLLLGSWALDAFIGGYL
jgi:hypothetical protein